MDKIKVFNIKYFALRLHILIVLTFGIKKKWYLSVLICLDDWILKNSIILCLRTSRVFLYQKLKFTFYSISRYRGLRG